MKLVVELPSEAFDAVDRGDISALHGPVTSVEIKQADSLFSIERPALMINGLSTNVAHQLGIADGAPIRVWFGPKENADDDQD